MQHQVVKLAMVQQQRLAHQVFSFSGVDLYGGSVYQGIELRVAKSPIIAITSASCSVI